MTGFLVDEDLSWRVARALADAGLQAFHVSDVDLRSRPDEVVLAYARAHGLALVTCDLAYADLRRFPLGSHPGLIVVRLPNRLPAPERTRTVVDALLRLDPSEIPGSLIVLTQRRIRRRNK